jgi:hypothetical protein
MAEESIAGLEAALRRACPRISECATARAISDFSRHEAAPVPTTEGGWHVQHHDDRLLLRVIVGRSLHVISGACVHHDPQRPDDMVNSELDYRRLPFKPDADFACEMAWGERKPHGEAVVVEEEVRWTLDLTAGGPIELHVKPKSQVDREKEDAPQVEAFARATLIALAEPVETRGHLR